jgi:hypothetical protein
VGKEVRSDCGSNKNGIEYGHGTGRCCCCLELPAVTGARFIVQTTTS